MTNINVELPPALHIKLKLRAAREEKTLEQVVTEILEKRVKS